MSTLRTSTLADTSDERFTLVQRLTLAYFDAAEEPAEIAVIKRLLGLAEELEGEAAYCNARAERHRGHEEWAGVSVELAQGVTARDAAARVRAALAEPQP